MSLSHSAFILRINPSGMDKVPEDLWENQGVISEMIKRRRAADEGSNLRRTEKMMSANDPDGGSVAFRYRKSWELREGNIGAIMTAAVVLLTVLATRLPSPSYAINIPLLLTLRAGRGVVRIDVLRRIL
jgi:hypothetical protein